MRIGPVRGRGENRREKKSLLADPRSLQIDSCAQRQPTLRPGPGPRWMLPGHSGPRFKFAKPWENASLCSRYNGVTYEEAIEHMIMS
jgi:hypothetical protein